MPLDYNDVGDIVPDRESDLMIDPETGLYKTTTTKVTTTNVRTIKRTVNGVTVTERITTITYPDGTQEVFTEIL